MGEIELPFYLIMSLCRKPSARDADRNGISANERASERGGRIKLSWSLEGEGGRGRARAEPRARGVCFDRRKRDRWTDNSYLNALSLSLSRGPHSCLVWSGVDERILFSLRVPICGPKQPNTFIPGKYNYEIDEACQTVRLSIFVDCDFWCSISNG